MKIKFYKGRMGRKAYVGSKVWRLGFHIFVNGENLIFRLCYLRNKKGTHYVQLSVKIKEELDCGCGC
jgi:hypothetical protein